MSVQELGGVAEYIPQAIGLEFRAHHLEVVSKLLTSGIDASLLVEQIQEYAGNWADKRGPGSRAAHYYQEVYPNDEVSALFNSETVGIYEKFLDLDDNAPVWIVDNRKDPICAGCPNDNHCLRPIDEDEDYIRATIETATDLGVTYSQEQIETTDKFGNPVSIIRIGLTAATARRIFEDPYFNCRAEPNKIRRAMAIWALSEQLNPGQHMSRGL